MNLFLTLYFVLSGLACLYLLHKWITHNDALAHLNSKHADNVIVLKEKYEKEIWNHEKKYLEMSYANTKHYQETKRAKASMHEAIDRPKGVIPKEAEEFYNPNYYVRKYEYRG